MIITAKGDLLRAQVDALINPVNCVGVMGKGLALQFRKEYPEMFRVYALACEAGEVLPGRIHVWPTGAAALPRFILNFPTKRHWRDASRLDDIEAGLRDLVAVIQRLGIRSIAIPALGAGLGGLEWSAVRPLIVQVLEPLVAAEVHLYEPTAT